VHEQGGVDVKVGGEDVEAEGGEFKVTFDDGTEAILNQEQMQRYENGEDIESILAEMPTTDEAKMEAQQGDQMGDDGQIPEEGEMPAEDAILARGGVVNPSMPDNDGYDGVFERDERIKKNRII